MSMNLKTVNEVASILSLSPLTVRIWIKKGKISAVRLGPRSIRISATEIERLMK